MIALVRMASQDLRTHQERILEIETLSSPTPWGLSAFEAETTNPFSRFWGVTGHETLRGYICFWLYDRAYEPGSGLPILSGVHPRDYGRWYYRNLPLGIFTLNLHLESPARTLSSTSTFVGSSNKTSNISFW